VDNSADLELLVQSRQPIVIVESAEEERVEELVRGVASRLSLPLFEWRLTHGLTRLGTTDPLYDTDKPAQALKSAAAMHTDALYLFWDLGRHLEDPLVLRGLKDLARLCGEPRRAVILAGADATLPSDLAASAAVLPLPLPDETALRAMVVKTLRDLGAPRRIRVALDVEGLKRLVTSLRGLTGLEAQRLVMRAALEDLKLDEADLRAVLERKKELLARDGVLTLHPEGGALSELGGLDSLKTWLETRSAAFAPSARAAGLDAPRGLLLLGVQGCGKSRCARAVAALWRLPLLQLDAGTLYDKYVGESERHLREALRAAGAMAPSVLWIDEIEKGFAAKESAADGGLSRRVLGTFLSWLQDRKEDVFVVATANDVESLPPELLRKGRFDEIFFVDLPGEAARRAIFAIHLARRKQDPARFDLAALAAASYGFSGAEIEAAVVSALYTAFAARTTLTTEQVRAALLSTVPLSRTCREAIEGLRSWARGRAVPASTAGLESAKAA
jgi:SpoVK/Ycf46/Vps4 family AAA+-type ATPase